MMSTAQQKSVVLFTGPRQFPTSELIPDQRQCLQAITLLNAATGLSREARRVGIALAVMASTESVTGARVERIARHAGLTPARAIAGLTGLHDIGLARRLPSGFGLVWEALP